MVRLYEGCPYGWPVLMGLPGVLLPGAHQYIDVFDSESDSSGDLSDEELVEVP